MQCDGLFKAMGSLAFFPARPLDFTLRVRREEQVSPYMLEPLEAISGRENLVLWQLRLRTRRCLDFSVVLLLLFFGFHAVEAPFCSGLVVPHREVTILAQIETQCRHNLSFTAPFSGLASDESLACQSL